jgi:DNA-binding XRE family transcriptional regulator
MPKKSEDLSTQVEVTSSRHFEPVEKSKEENLVKRTCRELGITQKELAEKIGVHDVTVRNWSSKGDIPEYFINHLNLLIEYNKEIEFKNKFKEMLNFL